MQFSLVEMRRLLRPIFRPLAITGIALLERMTGFATDPTGWLINRLAMLRGSYERFLVESILGDLPEDGVFVDVGANVGAISRAVARSRANVTIIAFEPNPRIYPLLQSNLKPFSKSQAYNFGLGADKGLLEFYHGKESCVGSFVASYTNRHVGNVAAAEVSRIKVKVSTGDEELSHLRQIDVMKIDVEGFETEVFNGLRGLLSQQRIGTIFFEFCPYAQRSAQHRPREVISLLTNSGYRIREIEGESAGRPVDDESVGQLILRLGDRGYTTLRATVAK